jgi:hypothetical protein
MDDERPTEAAEEELEREPDPGEPWAKTSSGDADNVTDEDG